MFKWLSDYMRQRIIVRSTITESEWADTFQALPILSGLTVDERQRLQTLAILFMHYKRFEAAQGLVLNRQMILTISLQACLPILELGLACYSGWIAVVVYPASFVSRRDITDTSGVVHHQSSNLSGEAWQRGPVIINWQEAKNAARIDGHNLLIHEFAHKLDMQNGEANGFPPLHADMTIDDWVTSFSAGFEHFQHHCDNDTLYGIDCYAATSPAEFFAVFSEVFFERPVIIRRHYPSIYAQLRNYYRQDPLKRLASLSSRLYV